MSAPPKDRSLEPCHSSTSSIQREDCKGGAIELRIVIDRKGIVISPSLHSNNASGYVSCTDLFLSTSVVVLYVGVGEWCKWKGESGGGY